MSDVLVISIPVPTYFGKDEVERSHYAGVNAVSDHGATHGKKSAYYLDLFRATREEARAQMARTGWTTAEGPCEVQIVRYHRTKRMSDAGNLGKAELDALEPSTPHEQKRDRCEPFPGVYLNDQLVRPFRADVEYDPDGVDRIVIIVRRRFPDVLTQAPEKRKRVVSVQQDEPKPLSAPVPPSRPKPSSNFVRVTNVGAAPQQRTYEVDGKLLNYDEFLKSLR